MAFWQLFYSVGSFIAYWVNYACGKHTVTLGNWSWKMVIVFRVDWSRLDIDGTSLFPKR